MREPRSDPPQTPRAAGRGKGGDAALGFMRQILLWVAVSATGPLSAQVLIPDTVSADHSAVVEPLLEIASEHGSVFLPSSPFIAHASGGFVIAPTYDRSIAVLDRSGQLVRTLGRAGEGPGEFPTDITDLKVDQLGRVHSLHGARVSVLAPTLDGIPAQMTVPVSAFELVLLEPGAVAVAPPASGMFILPRVTVVNADGEAEPEIHLPGPSLSTRGDPFDAMRALAPARGAEIWSSRINRYELTRVSRQGEPLETFRREAAWFPDFTYDPRRPYEEPPAPMVHAIREDGQGRVWVLIWVPAPNWSPTEPPTSVGHRDGFVPHLYDTVLEVLDLEGAQVLSRTRLSGPARFVEGLDGGVWIPKRLGHGEPAFELFMVSLFP